MCGVFHDGAYMLMVVDYDRSERLDAIVRAEKVAKEKGVGDKDMTLNVEAQETAQQFIAEMFNDTNMPLQELLTNIQSKVDDLDDVAKQIVGGVVGVEKEKVNGAIKELTVEGFFTLRDQFQKMGI